MPAPKLCSGETWIPPRLVAPVAPGVPDGRGRGADHSEKHLRATTRAFVGGRRDHRPVRVDTAVTPSAESAGSHLRHREECDCEQQKGNAQNDCPGHTFSAAVCNCNTSSGCGRKNIADCVIVQVVAPSVLSLVDDDRTFSK